MGKLCRGALEGTEGVEGNKATKGKRSRNRREQLGSLFHILALAISKLRVRVKGELVLVFILLSHTWETSLLLLLQPALWTPTQETFALCILSLEANNH